MSERQAFDDKYWNLAQAATWVEFRERGLVEQFSSADRDAYIALNWYEEMWPAGRKRRGSIKELERALLEERLRSRGYRTTNPNVLTEIPSISAKSKKAAELTPDDLVQIKLVEGVGFEPTTFRL